MTIDTTKGIGDFTFVAFDFETTGLRPAVDRVVEFGAVRFVIGQELAAFEELANPGVSINPDAARVNGITDEMVADKPPVDDVLSRFMAFVGDAILVAHNAPFDTSFLRVELQRAGRPTVGNPIIDTQTLARKAFPGKRSYSLQNLVDMLGIPTNTAHRARDDARQCMHVFEHCISMMSFMGGLLIGDVLT